MLSAWVTNSNVSINALSAPDSPTSTPTCLQLLFSRVQTPLGKARFKRSPKCIVGDPSSPVVNSISAAALKATNPLLIFSFLIHLFST
jgi:hypothetical protein